MLAYLSGRSAAPAASKPRAASSNPQHAPEPTPAQAVPSRPDSSPHPEPPPPAGPVNRTTERNGTPAPVEPLETLPPSVRAEPTIAERLVEIVRDRTGYPAEMLHLDLDLEADLGIDSIKRVEILGTLRDALEGLVGLTDSSLMDSLARARTLGEIVERLEAARTRPEPEAPAGAGHPAEAAGTPGPPCDGSCSTWSRPPDRRNGPGWPPVAW